MNFPHFVKEKLPRHAYLTAKPGFVLENRKDAPMTNYANERDSRETPKYLR
jgi:hypothetical protein